MDSLIGYFGRLHEDDGISFASVSGAGAVSWARLSYWDPESKAYQDRDFDEQLEVVSFQGNIALKELKPFAHLHVVLGRPDFSTVGGHLRDATVYPTLEIWLRTEDVVVERRKDESTGLDLLDLEVDVG